MVPPPPFKIAASGREIVQCGRHLSDGAVKAKAILSWLIVFCDTTVPFMPARLWILIPVGPEVAVSTASAPF